MPKAKREISREIIDNGIEPNNIEVTFDDGSIGIYLLDGTHIGHYEMFNNKPKGSIGYGDRVFPNTINI